MEDEKDISQPDQELIDIVENADERVNWRPLPPTKEERALAKAEKASISAASIKRTRQIQFLRVFAEVGNPTQACKAIGINSSTRRAWVEKDPWFREQFKAASEEYADAVIAEVHNRAINGVEVPIIGKKQVQVGTRDNGDPIFAPEDVVIGVKTVKSDVLLMFHAKKVIPAYREDYVDQKDNEKPIESVSPMSRITIQLDVMGDRKKAEIPSIFVQPQAQLPPGPVIDVEPTDTSTEGSTPTEETNG